MPESFQSLELLSYKGNITENKLFLVKRFLLVQIHVKQTRNVGLARTSSIKIPNHTLPRPIQQRAAANIGVTLSVGIELVFLTPSQLRMGEARYERQVFRAELPCSHF